MMTLPLSIMSTNMLHLSSLIFCWSEVLKSEKIQHVTTSTCYSTVPVDESKRVKRLKLSREATLAPSVSLWSAAVKWKSEQAIPWMMTIRDGCHALRFIHFCSNTQMDATGTTSSYMNPSFKGAEGNILRWHFSTWKQKYVPAAILLMMWKVGLLSMGIMMHPWRRLQTCAIDYLRDCKSRIGTKRKYPRKKWEPWKITFSTKTWPKKLKLGILEVWETTQFDEGIR